MHGLSPSFRSALLPMAVTTDLGAGANQTELLRDRLCLPSPTELGLGNLPAEEGAPLAIFQNAWNRERCFTPEGLAANASSSKPADSETPWRFWLRASASASAVYQANATSYTNEPPWYGQAGILPMGCLPGELTVSNMQDKDGCFVLVFNQRPDAPRISSPQAGQRVKTGFYLEFLPAADAEGGHAVLPGGSDPGSFLLFRGVALYRGAGEMGRHGLAARPGCGGGRRGRPVPPAYCRPALKRRLVCQGERYGSGWQQLCRLFRHCAPAHRGYPGV